MTIRRRQFWCPWSRREVDVEFQLRGLPGFRGEAGVRGCSAFEPPAAVGCQRRCLDPAFRRHWEPALPVYTGRQP